MADLVLPEFGTVGEGDGVETAVIGPEEDLAVGDDGGAFDLASGREGPDALAVGALDAMEALVASAEEDAIGGDGGRGGVGKGSVAVTPEDLAVGEVDAEELVLVMADVGLAVGECGRADDRGAGLDLAGFGAVPQVEDVDDGVASAEDGFAIGDGGGAVDVVAGLVDPVGPAGVGVEGVELEVVGTDEDGGGLAGAGRVPGGAALDLFVESLRPDL